MEHKRCNGLARDLQPIEELCPYVLCSPCRADPALSGMTPVLGCRRTYSFSPHKQTYLWWHTGILCEPGHVTYTPEYIARRLRNRQQSASAFHGRPGSLRWAWRRPPPRCPSSTPRYHAFQISGFCQNTQNVTYGRISNISVFGNFDKCEFSLQHREFVRPLRF